MHEAPHGVLQRLTEPANLPRLLVTTWHNLVDGGLKDNHPVLDIISYNWESVLARPLGRSWMVIQVHMETTLAQGHPITCSGQ